MITREQIPTVLDHPVHDARGDKIGDARHVFFDDVTGEPEWVSVRTGLFGTSESFVPIHDAALVDRRNTTSPSTRNRPWWRPGQYPRSGSA
ncbi:hypothetical protein BJ965_000291 [Streptomyces luteogriseus]|uniref:PRC-barrel domain containing protein n=1 Tax=Streptomyces luteogriseus TaxID=68233 RepID=A0A7W7DGI1_9ACTN|nr:hypothetical protein [Streptomyces luteogriseus]